MVKQISLTLAIVLLFLNAAVSPPVVAAVNDLKIEQVQIEMPEVQAYFLLNSPQAPSVEDITATLGSHALQVEMLRPYDPTLDVTSYFFLVDCSTSTTRAQMEAVKAGLHQFVDEDMDANSTLTLITFGVDVQVPLHRETNATTMGEAIDLLVANQPGTVFFDALAKAIDIASNKAYALERKVAFVFSDSVDYNLGGHTKEEVDNLLVATGLPFYAIGFDTGGKPELDNFGAVARASGGDIVVTSAKNLPDNLKTIVQRTKSAWMVRFDAGTNIADKNHQEFVLAVESQGLTATMVVPVRHWRADNTAPEIIGIEQATNESLKLVFSKLVNGANLPENYAITDEKGDLLGIKAAAYNEAENTVILTFSSPPGTGAYTVECPNIVDRTMEQNRVGGKTDFSFEGAPEPPAPELPVPEPPEPVGAWIFISLLGLAIIAAVAVNKVRKNQRNAHGEKVADPLPSQDNSRQEKMLEQVAPAGKELHVHFRQVEQPFPKIKLQVSGPNGQGRLVEMPVNKTLFVGRSDICDVYFDDATMSRQHFVIGEENGHYTISNLSTSHGTLLNGVKLQSPRVLQNGDSIQAGRQTIVFFSPTDS